MTTDLSLYDATSLPGADVLKRQRYAIIVADWNNHITFKLAQGAIDTLLKHGVQEEHIIVQHVPGTVELTYAAARLITQPPHSLPCKYDAIIVIGCVIQGETPHFDYVCQGTTQGISYLNANYKIPFIFGLLTTDNLQQALDRCGGAVGNKGIECAVTAIKMIALQNEFEKKR